MTITKRYGVFVVRIWREPAEAEEGPWRASVLNTATKERTYFTTAEGLAAFLSPLPSDEQTLLQP